MSYLFRFIGRILTLLGFAVLGADLLASLEHLEFSPHPLSLLDIGATLNDSAPVLATAFAPSSPLSGMPISILFIWFGAVLLAVFAPPRT